MLISISLSLPSQAAPAAFRGARILTAAGKIYEPGKSADLVLYDAEKCSPHQAKRYAPELNFDLPVGLPGGFRLETVYLLRFGDQPGVAATYGRSDEFLGVVFHAPVRQENFGMHKDYPCVIGKHRGHKVSVGEWRLVHLTDPTTCHCVLSRLNEYDELPPVMAAVAPRLPGSSTHRH